MVINKQVEEEKILKFANLDNSKVTKSYWIGETFFVEKDNGTKRPYTFNGKLNMFMPGEVIYL